MIPPHITQSEFEKVIEDLVRINRGESINSMYSSGGLVNLLKKHETNLMITMHRIDMIESQIKQIDEKINELYLLIDAI